MFILKFLLILIIAFIATIGFFVWRVFRAEEANRKIIPDNEGEYVDYEDA